MTPALDATEAGYEGARRLLALPEPPTAIFAGNDEIAFGALEAARELGVSIPERLFSFGTSTKLIKRYSYPDPD